MPKPVSRLPPPNRACPFQGTRLSLRRSYSLKAKRPETPACRHPASSRRRTWDASNALRLRGFCISPISIGTFPHVLNRLPLLQRSRQTAALGSPRLSPGSSLLWRHRLPSKASMAHSSCHPSTGLQRSCLLTPMVWFRRRDPIDPIRSLRNPDHPGGNPGPSPAPAHRVRRVARSASSGHHGRHPRLLWRYRPAGKTAQEIAT